MAKDRPAGWQAREKAEPGRERIRLRGAPDHERPAGLQGRNFGYWQADGATRSAAKRSKRP